jgi:hypothetical protein
MKNLAHSAFFDSDDNNAPSKPGIKHLTADYSTDHALVRLAVGHFPIKPPGVVRPMVFGDVHFLTDFRKASRRISNSNAERPAPSPSAMAEVLEE